MRAEFVPELIAGLKEGGVRFVAGLPDSWLRNVLEAVEQDPDFLYVPVGNEGVGFSVCAGAWLGGKRPALLMENSGLRVATEYIARLSIQSHIPVLLVMSYRGDMGDAEYWSIPHGTVVEPLLNALRIPYLVIREPAQLKKSVTRAIVRAEASQYPTAILVGGDLIWE